MTNQEAIERIERHMRIHFTAEYPHAVYITEALKMAINALKAQIPVEPIIKQFIDHYDTFETYENKAFCPKCGNELHGGCYCSSCGQAVKWK